MKRRLIWAVLWVSLVVSIPSTGTAGMIRVAPDLWVVDTQFGLLETDEEGQQSFIPFSFVPLEPGQKYGWVAWLQTNRLLVRWREELDMPAVPYSWGRVEEEGVQVTPNGRLAVTERIEPPLDGLLSNYWSVVTGDPVGLYTLRLYIEDTLVRTFYFHVE
jgi:hypothetical protein